MTTQATFDVQAAIAEAAAKGKDMNEVESGGGDYTPPPEGTVMLRFVSYVETGKHTTESKQYGKKTANKALLGFELHGKNYPYIETNDGKKVPMRIEFSMTVSRHERAAMSKLFNQMNWQGDAKVFAQLLGREFLGTVVHDYWGDLVDDGKGGKRGKNISARLRDDAGYTIRSPFLSVPVIDTETGVPTGEFEQRRIPVPAALTDLRLFLWDFASKPMWDALFIDGKYDDRKDKDGNVIPGKSKNKYQDLIRSAENFSELGHVIDGLDGLELGEDETNLVPDRKPEDVAASEEAAAATTQATNAAKVDVLAVGADELAI